MNLRSHRGVNLQVQGSTSSHVVVVSHLNGLLESFFGKKEVNISQFSQGAIFTAADKQMVSDW
jgi:hypothetical protein